jgi:hypothetical protein
MDPVGDEAGPARRSLGALADELADLRRRINEHRAFLAWLDDRLRARTGRSPDQPDGSTGTPDPDRLHDEITA